MISTIQTCSRGNKLPRFSSNNREDRLTNLHDSVVSHILSRLPTTDAIRTSVLSKDWKNKWTLSYNVCIDDYMYEKNDKFLDRLSRMLSYFERLRNFCLTTMWTFMESRYVQAWIDDALKHKIECFEVDINIYKGLSIVFPCFLLNHTSLKELKLKLPGFDFVTRTMINVVARNCSPNLTSLDLYDLEIVNCNPSSSTVTFNFPVLETLTFNKIRCLNVKSVEIYAPSLTEFTSLPPDYQRQEEYDYSMTVFAPKLTSFSGSVGLPETFILNGASVSTVTLTHSHGWTFESQLHKTVGYRTRRQLNEFTGLEELRLSYFCAEVISLGPLSRFDKLSRLTLPHCGVAAQLFYLLHAMPSLKFLSMYIGTWEDYAYEDMECIPSCIISHLEEVVLLDFYDNSPCYNFAKFLLKTAEKMNSIRVYCCHQRTEIEAVLSKYPRCSLSLTVNVIEADNDWFYDGL